MGKTSSICPQCPVQSWTSRPHVGQDCCWGDPPPIPGMGPILGSYKPPGSGVLLTGSNDRGDVISTTERARTSSLV